MKKKTGKIINIVVLIILLSLVGMGIYSLKTNPESDMSDKFFLAAVVVMFFFARYAWAALTRLVKLNNR